MSEVRCRLTCCMSCKNAYRMRAGQVSVSLTITGPKKALHASLQRGRGGQLLFRTLCASPPPHLHSTKGTLPLVPTHKEFLRHCWVHHDNWVLNKAFLLGILPFTGERRGDNSQRRERQKRERRGGALRGRVEELEMMGGNSGGCRGESYRPG